MHYTQQSFKGSQHYVSLCLVEEVRSDRAQSQIENEINSSHILVRYLCLNRKRHGCVGNWDLALKFWRDWGRRRFCWWLFTRWHTPVPGEFGIIKRKTNTLFLRW